jgi:hypothetical protein
MKLHDFIDVAEVDDIPADAEALFQRKYKRSVPDFPHHILAYWRAAAAAPQLACYIHFTDCGDILLGGGACTDDRVLRRMPAQQRDVLRTAGGIYQHTLEWSVRHFSGRFAAVFGYCGDTLAERVDRAAGFEPTSQQHLLVYWMRKVDARHARQMIAKATAFSPF